MNKVGYGILATLGIVFIIGGSIFVGIFPGIMRKKIEEELPLVNNSDSYKRWQEVKVPITMKFHFFHLNNSETYTSLDDIELIETGPYVYDEKRHKERITIDDDMISYQEYRKYEFIPTNANENETINFINFPNLGLLKNENQFYLLAMPQVFSASYPPGTKSDETGLFIKRRIVDILFNGVPYLSFKMLSKSIPGISASYSISKGGKQILEEKWKINSGTKSINQIGQLYEFNTKTTLVNEDNSPIWPMYNTAKSNCTELKGTDGTFFAPDVSKDDVLYAFEPQLCRTVFFHFWKETEVRGIKTYRFVVPDDYFKSGVRRTENMCYCLEKNKTECDLSGVLPISHCTRQAFYAPIFMSAPYYNHGETWFREQFKTILEPKKELNDENYGTYLDIEPMTGMVLKAVRRLQMNIKIMTEELNPFIKKIIDEKMPQLGKSKNKEYLVPVFWIEESGEADEDQANDFKSMVTNKKKLANGLSITVIVVGALMAILAIYLYIRSR